MNTHRVDIYRFEGGEWKFDHVLNDSERDCLSAVSLMANGYNRGTLRDPKWPFIAVAVVIKGREDEAELEARKIQEAERANAGCTCNRVGLCERCREAASILSREDSPDV